MSVTIALATRNRGKLAEFQDLFGSLDFTVQSLDQLGVAEEVEETGETFAENAALKARAAVLATGLPALADDSGLEVDALGGEPGVRSARWAGAVGAADRNARLLQRLAGVPDAERGARFVCVIAVCHPTGGSASARGEVAGRITRHPQGENGFGYDPLFLLPDLGRTYAQLTPEEKNGRSHRARAFAALRPLLPSLLLAR
ncbi:MAG: RdgB/HAM1 family non-canonical purine NTP pyrophosphatase [Chloroflexota bacterium]